MKKIFGIGLAFLLVGCSPEPVIDTNINLDQDKTREQALTAKLQQADPNVVGSRYVFDANGNRTIEVAKKDESGNISVWNMPPEVIKNTEQQATSTSSFAADDFILGALSGYALSNLLSSPPSQSFNSSQYNRHVDNSSRRYVDSVKQDRERRERIVKERRAQEKQRQAERNNPRSTKQPSSSRGGKPLKSFRGRR